MSNGTLQTCRLYEDYLAAILETFGQNPFTIQGLREKGIIFPAKKTLHFFRIRKVFVRYERGRPSTWVVSPACREYLAKRRGAV